MVRSGTSPSRNAGGHMELALVHGGGTPTSKASGVSGSQVQGNSAALQIAQNSIGLQPPNGPLKRQADVVEMLAFVQEMGIDPVKESEMVWIAEEAFNAPLPPGWQEYQDEQGRAYFHCVASGVSAWQHPMDGLFRDVVDYYRRIQQTGGFWVIEDELAELEEKIRKELSDWMELFDEHGEKFYYNRTTEESQFADPRNGVYHNLYTKIKMVAKMRDKLPLLARAPRPDDPTERELELQRLQEEEEKRFMRAILRIQSLGRGFISRKRVRNIKNRRNLDRVPPELKGKLRLRIEPNKSGGRDELVLAIPTGRRKERAATKLQALARGKAARHNFEPMRAHRNFIHNNACVLQRAIKFWLAKRRHRREGELKVVRAAVTIQKWVRGKAGRKFVGGLMKQKRQWQAKLRAIISIQCAWRQRLARRVLRSKKSLNYVSQAILMQKQSKVFLAKQFLMKLEHQAHPIQCRFRCEEDPRCQGLMPFTWQMFHIPMKGGVVLHREPYGPTELFSKSGAVDLDNKAALMLQSAQRRKVAKAKVDAIRSDNALVAEAKRREEERRLNAAVRVQKMERGRQVRKMNLGEKAHEKFLHQRAPQIKKIQSYMERFLAQLSCRSGIKNARRLDATVVIQTRWRGVMARKQYGLLREQAVWPLKLWFEYMPTGRDSVQMGVQCFANPNFDSYLHFVVHGSTEDLYNNLDLMEKEVCFINDKYTEVTPKVSKPASAVGSAQGSRDASKIEGSSSGRRASQEIPADAGIQAAGSKPSSQDGDAAKDTTAPAPVAAPEATVTAPVVEAAPTAAAAPAAEVAAAPTPTPVEPTPVAEAPAAAAPAPAPVTQTPEPAIVVAQVPAAAVEAVVEAKVAPTLAAVDQLQSEVQQQQETDLQQQRQIELQQQQLLQMQQQMQELKQLAQAPAPVVVAAVAAPASTAVASPIPDKHQEQVDLQQQQQMDLQQQQLKQMQEQQQAQAAQYEQQLKQMQDHQQQQLQQQMQSQGQALEQQTQQQLEMQQQQQQKLDLEQQHQIDLQQQQLQQMQKHQLQQQNEQQSVDASQQQLLQQMQQQQQQQQHQQQSVDASQQQLLQQMQQQQLHQQNQQQSADASQQEQLQQMQLRQQQQQHQLLSHQQQQQELHQQQSDLRDQQQHQQQRMQTQQQQPQQYQQPQQPQYPPKGQGPPVMAHHMQHQQQQSPAMGYPQAPMMDPSAQHPGAALRKKSPGRHPDDPPKVKPAKVRQSAALKVLAQAHKEAEPVDVKDRKHYAGEFKDGKFQKTHVSSIEQLSEDERQNILSDINKQRQQKVDELMKRQKMHAKSKRKGEQREARQVLGPDSPGLKKNRGPKVFKFDEQKLSQEEELNKLTAVRMGDRERRMNINQKLQDRRGGLPEGAGAPLGPGGKVMHRHIHHHVHYHDGEQGSGDDVTVLPRMGPGGSQGSPGNPWSHVPFAGANMRHVASAADLQQPRMGGTGGMAPVNYPQHSASTGQLQPLSRPAMYYDGENAETPKRKPATWVSGC